MEQATWSLSAVARHYLRHFSGPLGHRQRRKLHTVSVRPDILIPAITPPTPPPLHTPRLPAKRTRRTTREVSCHGDVTAAAAAVDTAKRMGRRGLTQIA
jgi:hypothetical protein